MGVGGSRQVFNVYVPASYIMYLSDFCRFLLCTCGWERRGERGAGGLERGGWNVEIGTEAGQFLFWEHINGIFVAVCGSARRLSTRMYRLCSYDIAR